MAVGAPALSALMTGSASKLRRLNHHGAVVVFRAGHPLFTELVRSLFSQHGDHPFARRRCSDQQVSGRRRDASQCVSQSPDGLIELLGGSRKGVAPVARIGHLTHRSGLAGPAVHRAAGGDRVAGLANETRESFSGAAAHLAAAPPRSRRLCGCRRCAPVPPVSRHDSPSSKYPTRQRITSGRSIRVRTSAIQVSGRKPAASS